jgi:uncharacterized RDD family membrane protein YckC
MIASMTQTPNEPGQFQPGYGSQPQSGMPGYPPPGQQPYPSPTPYGSQYQAYPAGTGSNTMYGGDPGLAEWWRRLLAYIIDAIVLGVIYFILKSLINPKGIGGLYLLLALLCVITFIYYGAQHARWGQTLGKRALGTMVVTADTRSKITGGTAAVRAAVYAIPPIVYFIGSLFVLLDVLWLTWDPRNQALHDKAAKTLVVKKDSLGASPYQ